MNQTSNASEALAPLRYTVRFSQPSAHLLEIELIVPTEGRDSIELMQPIWTPGSYLVREYTRQLEGMEARAGGGTALPVAKTRKNRWRISCAGVGEVKVTYRVYAREMSVQGNWVDGSFALLNGAPTFVTLADDTGPRAHEVLVVAPNEWKRIVTGLPDAPDGASGHFLAADYDTLVDCPIYVGNAAVYEFQVEGKPHHLVNEGEENVWDGPRSARDVEAIVRAQAAFWGFLPYEKYIFFNILSETGGGLEHKNSTVLMASRWATRKHASYLGWLNLVSHEYFHTWNVKRLRPVELGPFDYENEVYTPSLWIAEGVTSYYDRLFVRRAGLCTVDEFLEGDPVSGTGSEDASKNDIERLQETPGRLVQALENASFDAWIKFYRRDENTANTAISYYVKGAVVGWLLDAQIRKLTNNAKCLDDVMRAAYARYSGTRGYSADEFRKLASEVAGADLSDFFHRALSTTEELDYSAALEWFGLKFAEKASEKSKPETDESSKKPWLGIDVRNESGRLVVTQVRRDGPAYQAGLNVGDELLATGELRIPPDQWSKRLALYRPDETISFLISRRDRLMRVEAKLGHEPKSKWRYEIDPTATPLQVEHRKSWLGER